MTENKRFTYEQETLAKVNVFDSDGEFICCTLSIWADQLVDKLNALHEENEHYKSIFFELVETALTDKNCKELYCKGILNIFDKANSLNQARDMIKEFLE